MGEKPNQLHQQPGLPSKKINVCKHGSERELMSKNGMSHTEKKKKIQELKSTLDFQILTKNSKINFKKSKNKMLHLKYSKGSFCQKFCSSKKKYLTCKGYYSMIVQLLQILFSPQF